MCVERELDRLLGLVTVVGASVTTGRPPLIYEVSVSYLDRAVLVGGPWMYYARPEGRGNEIPASAQLTARLAPEWPEVAARIVDVVAGRLLLVYDDDIYRVLCAHLPQWEAADVVFAWDLAQAGWPELNMGPSPRGRATAAVQSSGILAMVEALLVDKGVIPPPEIPAAHTGGGDVYTQRSN
jgi:hypothetical protein